MKVTVTTESRFDRLADGTTWTSSQGAYAFWQRYLDEFEHVSVLARVRYVDRVPASSLRCDGDGVSVRAVPYYVGPLGYLRRIRAVHQAIHDSVDGAEAMILRVPGAIGSCAFGHLRRIGRPYGVEVIGDPWDVFAPGAVKHPLRPALRRVFAARLRRECAYACGAAYVTKEALQRRYACGGLSASVSDVHVGHFAVHYSSVALRADDFVESPRNRDRASATRLVTVGSLEQMYKGVDTLIDAVAALRRRGVPVDLTIVGDGRNRPALEARTERASLQASVHFVGQVPAGDAVTRLLDASDIFVLASRTEGLPRAMIEAMARGLPCIGTTAGGIPELLDPSDMVPPNDVSALADRIEAVMGDSTRRSQMSARNLARAHDYAEPVLRRRRNAFYRHIVAATDVWFAEREKV